MLLSILDMVALDLKRNINITAGCLFSHCCVAPLPVPGGVHVDANGGCGLVPSASQSVC